MNKISKYDIIYLYESWGNKNSNYEISGYHCYNLYRKFQNRRAKRNSGGVVIYVRNSIHKGVKLVRNHHDTIVWLQLDKTFFDIADDVFLAGVYVWVDGSPAYNSVNCDLFDLIQGDVHDFESRGKIFLTGDWNARVGSGAKKDYIACDKTVTYIDCEGYCPDCPLQRVSMDKTHNNFGIKLLDLCKSNSLRLANGRLGYDFGKGNFTYACVTGASVIDYLLLSERDFGLIQHFSIGSFNEWSDHAELSFTLSCNRVVNREDAQYSRTCIRWNSEMRDVFRRHLISKLPVFNSITNDLNPSSHDAINTCVNKFTDVIKQASEPLFYKEVKVHNKPRASSTVCKKADWFDDECRIAKSEYINARNLYVKNKCDLNRADMCSKKVLYKRLIRKKKRCFELKKIRQIENLRHRKPADFWKFFSSKRNNSSCNLNVDEFYTYFSSMCLSLPNSDNDVAEEFCETFDFVNSSSAFDELDSLITCNEIKYAINHLKRNKSFAGDQMLNEYFIEASDILMSHMCDIFNAILSSGFFPEQWMEGIIIPLFKKNDPNDVNNYRGITLVSCMSKIFTSIINKRVVDWSEANNVVSDAQFGFRKGRSTIDAIFVLNALINKVLNNNDRLYCAFIDFKKAFDSVYRNGLWFKLNKLGISGKILRIIRDMYTKVKARVKVCNTYSDFFECAIGLKQGEVMSPVLFALFLEDLELVLQHDTECGITIDDICIILLLFADDIALMSRTISGLQDSLDLLKEYCLSWNLEVNANKSKIMVFRKRGPLTDNESWVYNNTVLSVVDDFNYLGTVFHYTGKFLANQETLAGKGLRALNVLMVNVRKLCLKPSTLCQLFDAFVGSTLNYAGEIWGFGKNKEIERIHLKFCKSILHVKQSTSTMAIYGELGRYPLFINRHVRIIKYWAKIVSSDNIIIQCIYKFLLKQLDTNTKTWLSNVKHLIDTAGFSDVWLNHCCKDLSKFYLVYKQRLLDQFLQSWYTSVNNSPSLMLYHEFKANFGFETYLDKLPQKLRIPFTKLRLSCHQLRIETGRYGVNRVARNLRLCTICNSNDIEDEFHFVIVCDVYRDIRNKYIKKFYFTRPSVLKFVQLINGSASTVHKLCQYLFEAFALRQSLINIQQ